MGILSKSAVLGAGLAATAGGAYLGLKGWRDGRNARKVLAGHDVKEELTNLRTEVAKRALLDRTRNNPDIGQLTKLVDDYHNSKKSIKDSEVKAERIKTSADRRKKWGAALGAAGLGVLGGLTLASRFRKK